MTLKLGCSVNLFVCVCVVRLKINIIRKSRVDEQFNWPNGRDNHLSAGIPLVYKRHRYPNTRASSLLVILCTQLCNRVIIAKYLYFYPSYLLMDITVFSYC